MRSRSGVYRRSVHVLVVSLLVAVLPALAGSPDRALAAPTTCTGNAMIFGVSSDYTLWLYEHTTPSTGTWSWANIRPVGSGWTGTMLTGPNGRLYHIAANGDLHWFHYTGTGWANSGQPRVIGTGWGRYLQYHDQIAVDAGGRIYTLDEFGILRSYRFDETTWSWENPAGTLVDAWWPYESSFFTAGEHVLYRKEDRNSRLGTLRRFQYVEASQRWTQYRRLVSTAWDDVHDAFSPGGDVVYTIGPDGALRWYRYDADTDSWDNNGWGQVIGSGWHVFTDRIGATTNTCSTPAPVIGPTTPEGVNPAHPLQVADVGAAFRYYYVDGAGRAIRGGANVAEQPMGTQTFASNLSAAWEGAKFVAGIDGSGTVWLSIGGEPWHPWTSLGGSMRSVKLANPSSDPAPDAIGMDADGHLWWRPDRWLGWRNISGSARFEGEFSLAGDGPNPYGVASPVGSDGVGSYWFAVQWGGQVQSGVVPGAAEYELPAASDVFFSPKLLIARHRTTGQAFALFGDDASGGFETTWTALPPLAVASRPLSATELVSGEIAVAALGADGYVYVTSQVARDARQFHPWQRIGAVTAATGPTLRLQFPYLSLGFRATDGHVYHYQASSPPQGQPLTFTGGPISP